jgi:hypothetical protein
MARVRVLAISNAQVLNVVTWDGEWPGKRDQMVKKVLRKASKVETLVISKGEGSVIHALKKTATSKDDILAGE